MKVPFGTITITQKSKDLINQILSTKRVSGGELVREFEEKFAQLIGVKEAVAVSSGTAADTIMTAVLHDLGAERNDEVIVPALTFISSANAVLHAGFKPIFVDVKEDTFCIDEEKIEKAITKKTRAIMAVNLMGKMPDYNRIQEIAEHYNLYVLEDAAESHMAEYKGRIAGSLGVMGAFSTYIAHQISTGPQGGVITTNNPDLAEICRSLRAHGRGCVCKSCILNRNPGAYCQKRFSQGYDTRFAFDRIGYSARMGEFEAAIGIGSLENLDFVVKKRYNNLKYLIKNFGQFDKYLWTLEEAPHEKMGAHAFPIVIKKEAPFTREEFTDCLEKQGIETRTLFPTVPLTLAYKKISDAKKGDYPQSEYISGFGLHIGCHQDLSQEHLDFVLNVTCDFLKQF